MAKRNVYFSQCPDIPPEWYWERGLHDAQIASAELFEFTFDYNKRKNEYIRNQLTFKINAKNALYETDVKEISFINYKILSEDFTAEEINGAWWLSDRLAFHDKYYILEIDLYNGDNFTAKIKFESAVVKRG